MNADDGIVDQVAVDRAARGHRIRLTPAEREAAVLLMSARGHGPKAIAARLGLPLSGVERIRAKARKAAQRHRRNGSSTTQGAAA